MPEPSPRPLRVYVDVTDTLRNGWNAGIQRVLRAVSLGLAADDRIEVVRVVWSSDFRRFRPTTPDEDRDLADVRARGASGPAARPVEPSRSLRYQAHRVLNRLGLGPPLRQAARRFRVATRPTDAQRAEKAVLLPRLEQGSVLLELDAVWNVTDAPRSKLLPRLRRQGVRVVPFVHDLLPIQHPEWFVEPLVAVFTAAVRAQLSAADRVLVNSADTAAAVTAYRRELGLAPVPVTVVPLGADPLPPTAAVPPPEELRGRRYLLVVGTVEPRKNQRCVLDAFERVRDAEPDVDLVVVGRAGWRADDVVTRLDRAVAGGRVHWYQGMGDDQLDAVYRGAFLVLVPSLTEGFGLPVLEAVRRGVPVVSSPGGALAEVGAELAEFAPPDDPAAWAEVLLAHLRDAPHHEAARARTAAAPERPWADVCADFAAALLGGSGTVPADR